MPSSDPAHDALAAVLDAGDRLVEAFAAGDLDAADAVLAERTARLAALDALPRPQALPQALVVRFHAQDARLGRELRRQADAAERAMEAAGRASTAHARYHTAPTPPRLDTAPR